ncbi:MAG: hypothetical protein R3B54_16765 [Bdellovibrionota bacterium]
MRYLTHTALAFVLLFVPQPAFSDEFSEGVLTGLLEYFDVSDPEALAKRLASDPHFHDGPSSGAAADNFAELLYTKSPQKLTELRSQSAKQIRKDDLSDGQTAFARHLKLATFEALKIIDGKRRPADPRQNRDGDFLNDFADRYSELVQPVLDNLRKARQEQQKEHLFARTPRARRSETRPKIRWVNHTLKRNGSVGSPHPKKPPPQNIGQSTEVRALAR